MVIPTKNPAMLLLASIFFAMPPLLLAKQQSGHVMSNLWQQRHSMQDRILAHHHNTMHRHLDEEDVCSVLGTVFGEEDIYDPDTYQPVCQCTDVNSLLDSVTANPVPTEGSSLADVTEWVDGFNSDLLTNGWLITDETACTNACITCLEGENSLCGRFALKEVTEAQLELQSEMGFTFDDFAALSDMESDAILEDFNIVRSLYFGESCFDRNADGLLCYTFSILYDDTNGVGIPFIEYEGAGDTTCTVSLDGTNCNSCDFDLDQGCLTADCTNLFPGAIWPCEPTIDDFPGPFRPLYYNAIDAGERNYSVGSCAESETSVTTTAPVGLPMTSAPIPSLTGIPVAPPTDAPVTTSAPVTPTAAPVATTDAPVTSTTTDAPVVTATDAPVASSAATTDSPVVEITSTDMPVLTVPTEAPVAIASPTIPATGVNLTQLMGMVMPAAAAMNMTVAPTVAPATTDDDDDEDAGNTSGSSRRWNGSLSACAAIGGFHLMLILMGTTT